MNNPDSQAKKDGDNFTPQDLMATELFSVAKWKT